MGIFPDAQGQLTPQSLVRFGQISNSFETLKLSLLPAKMKKIRSRRVSVRVSVRNVNQKSRIRKQLCTTSRNQFFSRADNSGVGGGILPKFQLIQAFMHPAVSCKNEEDPIEIEGTRVFTTFSHYVYGGLIQTIKGS